MAKELARACASEANLMKTWSVVETKRLLICVKKYKHLYDPNDNLFGNDDAEREAFQNISKVFDRSDFQCLARWYDIEKRVTENTTKGVEHYLKELEFLIKIRTSENGIKRIKYQSEPEINVSDFESSDDYLQASQMKKSAQANEDFFRCVLDDLKKLPPDQQFAFKINMMNQLHYLKHEKHGRN